MVTVLTSSTVGEIVGFISSRVKLNESGTFFFVFATSSLCT